MSTNIILYIISIIIFIIDIIMLAFMQFSLKDKSYRLVFILGYIIIAIFVVADILMVVKELVV